MKASTTRGTTGRKARGSRRRKRLLVLLGCLAVVAALGLVAAPAARSHATASVPYHTRPEAAGLQPFSSPGVCNYGFYNPQKVFSYTRDYTYVYWRLWIAYAQNGAWKYEYGEWRRAAASTTNMLASWESRQWPYNEWALANGVASIYGPSSTDTWLGWEIYSGSTGSSHFEWLVNVRC